NYTSETGTNPLLQITSRNASRSYLKMVDNSYLGSSDKKNCYIDRYEVAPVSPVQSCSPLDAFHCILDFLSLFGLVVLHMFMYAVNIFFWRHYRVNYPFIFGFKQGTELGYREVFLVSTALATLALAAVLSNLDMEMDPKTKDYEVLTELMPLGLVILSSLHPQALITIVASLEIIRRGIWNFFRLENEHLNNVGKYRAFKSVPLPFNYDENEDKDE
ncbi:hypothetical protein IFM89_019366, partial [Coptis chinensis]